MVLVFSVSADNSWVDVSEIHWSILYRKEKYKQVPHYLFDQSCTDTQQLTGSNFYLEVNRLVDPSEVFIFTVTV